MVERTVGFFNVKNTSGEALYESVRWKLENIGLSLCNVVGCSFDGAANMKSEIKGVIAFIKKNDNPNCYFSWCLSHRFNLCVSSAVGISSKIKEVLSLAEDSAKIFRSSYKRMNVWVEVVRAVPNFNSSRRLKLIGKTRWSSKQDAMKSIIENETSLYVLIKALLKVCSLDNLDGDALVNASSNLNSWLQYDNVVVAFVLHNVFASVTPTTKSLQKMGANILDGVRALRSCKQQLQTCNEMLDDYIQQANLLVENTNFLLRNDKEIVDLDCDCCIDLPMEDEKAKKNSRIKNVFSKFIQKLLDQIDERVLLDFDESESIHHEMLLFDPLFAKETFSSDENLVRISQLCEINQISDENVAIHQLKQFTHEYIEYQNGSQSISFLANDDEIDDNDENEVAYQNEKEFPLLIESESDAEETHANLKSVRMHSMNGKKCYCIDCILKYICSNEERMIAYANILKIYKYVATLPSTQVKCERDFSKLKLTKTRLRSSLCEESLENLIIISTESGMFQNVNLDDVVDEIVASSSRVSAYM